MKTELKIPHYRVYLVEELTKRRLKNPAYSLRSFARMLKLPASSLSQVLLGKRPLTLKTATRIADALALDPKERKRFLNSALAFSEPEQNAPEWATVSLLDLELDKFKFISEWYHLGVLALADFKENRFNSSWISSMLGITKKDASQALLRLERMGMLARKGKRFIQKIPAFQVTAPQGSVAIRHFHKSALQLAERSLEKDSVDEREFNTMTMAIDVAKLPEAKKRIVAFRNELCAFLETGNQNQVYLLSLQLFPISKKEGSQT